MFHCGEGGKQSLGHRKIVKVDKGDIAGNLSTTQSNDMSTMKTHMTQTKTTRKTNQEKALEAFCRHVANARKLTTLIARQTLDLL